MTAQLLNVPVGTVLDYAGSTVPAGYLECDGSAVSEGNSPRIAAGGGGAFIDGRYPNKPRPNGGECRDNHEPAERRVWQHSMHKTCRIRNRGFFRTYRPEYKLGKVCVWFASAIRATCVVHDGDGCWLYRKSRYISKRRTMDAKNANYDSVHGQFGSLHPRVAQAVVA